MEIILLILVLLLFFYILKQKKKKSISEEALDILEKYFDNIKFNKKMSITELKEILEINNNKKFQKTLNYIFEDAKHKISILEKYRLNHNLPFNDISFLKVTANCVIDYSIRKNYNLKDSIKILIITLTSPDLIQLIGKEGKEKKALKNFSILIEGFIKRYNKKNDYE